MIIINLLGLALIAVIVWWFWLFRPSPPFDLTAEDVTIVVDNGVYQPSVIKVPANQMVKLQFYRKDASPCAATVLFPTLEISEELPVDAVKQVDLPPMPSGEYAFHCPMKMYKGMLIVEEK